MPKLLIPNVFYLSWLQIVPTIIFSGPKRAIWEEISESRNALSDAEKYGSPVPGIQMRGILTS